MMRNSCVSFMVHLYNVINGINNTRLLYVVLDYTVRIYFRRDTLTDRTCNSYEPTMLTA